MTGEWIVWSYTAAFYETGDIVSFASALLSLLPIFIVIFLAGLASASRYPRQDAALVLLLALCQNTVLNAILKKVLKMPRPHHYLRRSGEIGAPSSHGMPSDHAQFMFFFVTWLLRKAHANKIPVPVGMQLFLLGAATLVACGRVYNSFHTVAQVVVGAIVGIVNAYTLSSTFGVKFPMDSVILAVKHIASGKGLIDFIIRPPRAEYDVEEDLGPRTFRINENDPTRFRRVDLTLQNMRGMELVCSWYRPQESQRLPCVVYLHGNRGSRYDALEALFLLGHGFSLFSFDASGSGLSDGEYISLGFYERQDLAAVVEYLSAQKDVDGIALWGRSMGAVTSIMYAAKDDSIKCIVCDSPFSTLRLVIRDLVKRYAWRRIPSKFVDGIVDRLRERIARRAAFDIDDLDTLKYASECVVPAFIFHGREDDFVVPAHSISVSDCFKGLCLHELVKGGHNDERDETVRDTIVSFLKLFLVLKSKREQPTAEEIAALKRDEAGLQNSEGQSVAEREKLHLPSENTPPENKTQNICAGAECEGMGHRGPRSVFLDPISFKRPHLINVTSTHTSDEPKESPHTSLNTR